MCTAASLPPAPGPPCRHPESCSLEQFLTKFGFSLMNSSKRAAEPGSFLGQCVGNRSSLIHMSVLIRADAPLLPRLLHALCLLWQSLISLDLDGSVAENAAPKLPLTADNRPLLPFWVSLPATPPLPPTPESASLVPYLPIFLLFVSSLLTYRLSSLVFLHFWIMSRTRSDVPLGPQHAPLTLITLLAVTGQ